MVINYLATFVRKGKCHKQDEDRDFHGGIGWDFFARSPIENRNDVASAADVVLDGAACVHLKGKGRKQRSVPLWKSTVLEVRAWLRLNPQLRDAAPLLPNRDGHAMTRCNAAQRLALAVEFATVKLPSLAGKRISPHTLRQSTAMHLLQSGEPFNIIALWLEHESVNTTRQYV